MEKENVLDEKLESGEISKSRYDHEKLAVLGKEQARFSARCDLESEGITYEDLGAVSERLGLIAKGDDRMLDKLDRLDVVIDRIGPEAAQDIADRRLKEGELSKKMHGIISDHVKRHRK